ncbi:hypothetical protein MNBD_GAMMA26-1204 [hydrothermal vent metagenome]|uniref:Large ribosomal RNA subunit accumulation protein YceD n=1 Tax=hydrothermal vent metagenome TaxID=652676 RepID=A0A3B1BCX4_9ZZZZ
MSSRFPDFVDPWRMADQEKTFSGRVAIADLPRLSKGVLGAQGEVELELIFGHDREKRAYIQGFVKADLILECQRCLRPMDAPLMSQLNIALVKGLAEAERLPEYYDPLLLNEPRIRLLDVVEDELLLSLPQVPIHAAGECNPESYQALAQDGAGQGELTAGSSPFAVLAELKQK